MITTNIDVIDGLVNEAVGIPKVCEKSVNDGDFPKHLWLQSDDAATTGKLARFRCKRMVNDARRSGHVIDASWVPIEPRATTLTLDRKTGVACKRRQFPLVQASAITVHKSQGGTYPSIVHEYNKTHPRKLVYVALSRCTNVKNLYLTNTKAASVQSPTLVVTQSSMLGVLHRTTLVVASVCRVDVPCRSPPDAEPRSASSVAKRTPSALPSFAGHSALVPLNFSLQS
ncbi:hypothetical protein HPB50_009324 [Hyalomma asiaticum]|uniref:Uncharacterized protein n=1 Tax=Hyalomma asiaticum TaxID=266040 RepID=A0ACB7S2B4_HYAAI|nr:hypothetical protein HPB50_009324 [Hyalomma asiaticum]